MDAWKVEWLCCAVLAAIKKEMKHEKEHPERYPDLRPVEKVLVIGDSRFANMQALQANCLRIACFCAMSTRLRTVVSVTRNWITN